jgi:nicotinamidase/pyrazinamidase
MSFAETHSKEPHTGPEKLKLTMEDGTTLAVDQMMWPRHCVENTEGAVLHSDLIVTTTDLIVRKGTKKNVESYSAFGDAFYGKYEKTILNRWLGRNEISDIILTGIASDYCVYFTALDAIRIGYNVHIILSCTRGVAADTTKKAFDDLKTQGVIFYKNVDEFHKINKSNIIFNYDT